MNRHEVPCLHVAEEVIGVSPALEDQIGAGAIISRLQGSKSPEARAAEALFHGAEDTLHDTLRSCSSGKELIEKGYEADVEFAARLDVSHSIPVMSQTAYFDKAIRTMRPASLRAKTSI